jgi:hypothetical protein
MQIGAFGLGGVSAGRFEGDLNSIDYGLLGLAIGANATNKPSQIAANTLGILQSVIWNTTSSALQTFTPISGSVLRSFVRVKNGNSWKPWTEILTSENFKVQTNPADATAGRILTVGAFGLGANAILETNSGFNTAERVSGFYFMVNPTVAPTNKNQFLLNIRYDQTSTAQLTIDGDGVMHTRIRWANAWKPWRKLLDDTDATTSKIDNPEGKLLRVGDYGLGTVNNQYPLNNNADAFDIAAGFYRFNDDFFANPPNQNPAFQSIVLRVNVNNLLQIAFDNTKGMFIRSSNGNAGAQKWGEWRTIYNEKSNPVDVETIFVFADTTITRNAPITEVNVFTKNAITLTFDNSFLENDVIYINKIFSDTTLTLNTAADLRDLNDINLGKSNTIKAGVACNLKIVARSDVQYYFNIY